MHLYVFSSCPISPEHSKGTVKGRLGSLSTYCAIHLEINSWMISWCVGTSPWNSMCHNTLDLRDWEGALFCHMHLHFVCGSLVFMWEGFLKAQVIFSQLHISEKVLGSPVHKQEGSHLCYCRCKDWPFLHAPHSISSRTGLLSVHPALLLKSRILPRNERSPEDFYNLIPGGRRSYHQRVTN